LEFISYSSCELRKLTALSPQYLRGSLDACSNRKNTD
jgi:hypothetical protein